MHWKTYGRLREEYFRALGGAAEGLAEQVKRFAERVACVAEDVRGLG